MVNYTIFKNILYQKIMSLKSSARYNDFVDSFFISNTIHKNKNVAVKSQKANSKII